MMREGQVMFTYFHFRGGPHADREVLKTGSIAVAYETITDATTGCRC